MRISDWSSDVCSSDLPGAPDPVFVAHFWVAYIVAVFQAPDCVEAVVCAGFVLCRGGAGVFAGSVFQRQPGVGGVGLRSGRGADLFVLFDRFGRSEAHTSDIQSLMRI